jgi:uncharacterized protein (TIGR02646 family)
MKYIDKTSEASINRAKKLEKWIEDFKNRNPNSEISWEVFTKNALNGYGRKELYQDLWEEQGGICCYCGQKIPEPKKESGRANVEHVELKSLVRAKSLQYDNLILSCMGMLSETLRYGEKIHDVAHRIGIRQAEAKIVKFTQPLIEKEGATVFLSKSKHCNLKRNNDKTPIVVPTNEQYNTHTSDCWRLFKYEFNEDKLPAECLISETDNNDQLTKDTFRVLGLNCDILAKERGKLYETFENLALYHDGEENKPRNKEERQLYFEQQLKTLYHFCSMDYSIILQNL